MNEIAKFITTINLFKIKQDNEEQRWSAKHSDYCQNKIFFKHRRERDSQIEWRNLVRNTLLLREDYHRTEEIEKKSDENNEDENKLTEEKKVVNVCYQPEKMGVEVVNG